MSITSALSAGVGMVSWLVAARMLSQAELGVAAAFVSAFLLVAGCSELNLGVGLMRWLPRAGARASILLVRCAAAVATAAAVLGTAYLLLPGSEIILQAAADAAGGPVGAVAVYLLACVAWSLFCQQDFVFAGLGRAWWAPARMAVFAVGRLAIIVGFSSALTVGIVVWSWLVPVLVCVVLAAVQAVWFTRPTPLRNGDLAGGELPGRHAVLGFLGPTYAGQVGTSIMLNQLPLLVIFRFGPESGAAFFLTWQAITVIDVAAQYFAYSMAATIAREPERSAELMALNRRRLLGILLPVLALAALIAQPLLSIFGPGYARESLVMQVMLVGVAFRLIVVHRLGEHQAMGRGIRFAVLAITGTAVVLGSVLIVPGDLAAQITGGVYSGPLLSIAVSYVIAQIVCATVVSLLRWSARRRPCDTPSSPNAEVR